MVVIGYNDRANLPQAIRSVLDQSLRHLEVIVVDDASTDGSAEVADAIAAEDPRVRVVRLPENSGGCSRPRNTGLEHARAPYVMFLDSDDVYERHACKNLLLTAERTGADVVAGQVVRVHLTEQRETGWIKRLYTGRAVYRGIRENPEMFFDPLSTNKLYRRDFLDRHEIRFPEGVHYEDSLFSTKVYVHAEVIAVVPNIIYYWRVVQGEGEELSITQRRFRDRQLPGPDRGAPDDGRLPARAGRRGPEGLQGLQVHPARPAAVPQRPAAPGRGVPARDSCAMAAEYLATVSDETLAMCYPVERICVRMITRLDVAETLKTVDYLKFGFKLSTMLHERDGRVYWTDKYLDTARGPRRPRRHRHGAAPAALRAAAAAERDRRRLRPWRRPAAAARAASSTSSTGSRATPTCELWVSTRNRSRPERRRTPVTDVRHDGERIHYAVGARPREGRRRRSTGPMPNWDLRLEINWQGQTATRAVQHRPRAGGGAPVCPTAGGSAGP